MTWQQPDLANILWLIIGLLTGLSIGLVYCIVILRQSNQWLEKTNTELRNKLIERG